MVRRRLPSFKSHKTRTVRPPNVLQPFASAASAISPANKLSYLASSPIPGVVEIAPPVKGKQEGLTAIGFIVVDRDAVAIVEVDGGRGLPLDRFDRGFVCPCWYGLAYVLMTRVLLWETSVTRDLGSDRSPPPDTGGRWPALSGYYSRPYSGRERRRRR